MPRFDAEDALAILQDQRIDVSQWEPTHFRRLLELPEETRARYERPALRLAVHAAAPCPPSDKRAMIAWWGPILLEYYAGTEGGGTLVHAEEWLAHPGTVGRPWAHVDLGILDDDGTERPAGADGAVYFRDRAAAPFAYHGDETKTRAAHRGEWFTLGDIGHVDADGYLYLTDRQSDMIISGGVNIYPLETENCLMEHPAVADVAVIGVPDRALGEVVRAVVRLKPGFADDDAQRRALIEFARARIAHFKAPRDVEFVAALPRTETGKLQRRVLRAQVR
jgi:long-chain acyl-CoA synthetase